MSQNCLNATCANCPFLDDNYTEDFDGCGVSLLKCTKTSVYLENWEAAQQKRDPSCPLTIDEYQDSLKLWDNNAGTSTSKQRKCSCQIYDLMNYGCKCGGF
jgi:hypothetical protein